MERPKIENKPKDRKITGEIAYLDEMHRTQEGYPTAYDDLSDMARVMYEEEAAVYEHRGIRPEIMDLYDEYDCRLSNAGASCIALANELLALKDEKNFLSFIDICVDRQPEDVLEKLKSTRAGELLAGDGEQLAIASNGEYYPVLDMRKENADVVGVGVRVWGWNHEKYTFMKHGGNFDPKKDVLVYPSDEKSAQRQLEIAFTYRKKQPARDGSDYFTESVSLMVAESGSVSLSRSFSSPVYAETGYEGHGGKHLKNVEENDIAAFGDVVAEIVGDIPESVAMRQNREVSEASQKVRNPDVQAAIVRLIVLTWPAQTNYILSSRPEGSTKTLMEMVQSDETVGQGIEILQKHIEYWKKRRSTDA